MARDAWDPERLWEKCSPEPNTGCWLWFGSLNADGYGKILTDISRQEGAHRAAWRVSKGPIPKGLCVCHRCDVPSCINPDHLFLGTHAENSLDRHAKGRTRRMFQKGHPHYARRLESI